TLRDLRHVWATLALESGIHPKVVQERLGHSSIAMTMDQYSHVIEGLDRQAAATVADLVLRPSTQTSTQPPVIERDQA
ncbi:MAG: tyrosine-type recombinase/integrase, partial [Acidimicrobiia bacterium]